MHESLDAKSYFLGVVREPYFGMLIVYITALCFGTYHFIKILTVSKKETKKLLICYYIYVFVAYALRIFRCFQQSFSDAFDKPFQFYFSHAPGIFMIGGTITFFIYFLDTLAATFEGVKKSVYDKLFRIVKIFYAISISLLTIFYVYSFLLNYTKPIDSPQVLAFRCTYLAICSTISIFAIYVLIKYILDLREYPITFKDKKFTVFLVIIGVFFLGVSKMLYEIFWYTGIWRFTSKISENNYSYTRLCNSVLFFFYDIFPFISYSLYLKKNAQHIKILMWYEDETDVESNEDTPASVLEERLIKFIVDYANKRERSKLAQPINIDTTDE